MLNRALFLAVIAHDGQHRKFSNDPYVLHPLRVALQLIDLGVEDDNIIEAALLHDVVEDTRYTLSDLRFMGFSPETVEIVDLVTRREGEVYNDFIRRIANSGNVGAHLVKLMDIADNMADLPTGQGMSKRYNKAIKILNGVDE